MGKFNQGILGGFTGKVGNVVGQRSRGQWLYRAYQKDVANPKTTKQVANRKEFARFANLLKTVCKSELNQLIGKKFADGGTYFSFMMASTLASKKYYEKEITPKNKGLQISLEHETNIGSLPLIKHAPSTFPTEDILSFNNRNSEGESNLNYFGLRVPIDFYAGYAPSQIALNFLAFGYDVNKEPYVAKYVMPLKNVLEVSIESWNPACGLQKSAEDTHSQYVFEITTANTSAFKPILGSGKPLLREVGKGICYLIVIDTLGSVLYSNYKEILPTE